MSHTTHTQDTPRVYVGTYAKYNNGSIQGAWLDLEDYSSMDEFMVACHELHSDESDPELMFQDFEGIPSGMASESHIDSNLWDWINLDDDDKALLTVYRDNIDQEGTLENAQDAFMGTYSSPEDWAEEFLNDSGMLDAMPDDLKGYFDYSSYARDCGYNGMSFITVTYGEVWVFNSI